jgi:DNA invertase Pin-like site-specific DNA recombinase
MPIPMRATMPTSPKICRCYLRVSTDTQDLERQESIVEDARRSGFYVAATYREVGSGASSDRPELERLIADLQPGEVVVCESVDRLTRLPLDEAEKLVARIREKGARLSIPGLVDLGDLAQDAEGITRVVIDATQELLLKLALQVSHDDYQQRRRRQREGIERAKQKGKFKGRQADKRNHARILELRSAGHSIAATARIAGTSPSTVKRVCQKATRRSSGPAVPASGPAPAGRPG